VWHRLVNPEEIGLAGAAQLVRIDKHSQYVRQGRVIKETSDVAFDLTSLWPEEITLESLVEQARLHWSIENRQHYRRDRTQDEDRCGTRRTTRAWNLSLFRTLAIFLFEQQRDHPQAAPSLPSFEKRNHRRPRTLIDRFMGRDP
jgi:hypothetical protein